MDDAVRELAREAGIADEWIDAARKIYDEYKGKTQPVAHAIKMNMVIEEVPFGSGTVDAHMDTSSGEMVSTSPKTTPTHSEP